MTLMYLGVPIVGPSILFGDNESVVNTTSKPHGKLHKRHLMLSYHYVGEALALATEQYLYSFAFVSGKNNPSDILSKQCHTEMCTLRSNRSYSMGETQRTLWRTMMTQTNVCVTNQPINREALTYMSESLHIPTTYVQRLTCHKSLATFVRHSGHSAAQHYSLEEQSVRCRSGSDAKRSIDRD